MRSNVLRTKMIRQIIKQIARTGQSAARVLTFGISSEQWLAALLIGLLLLPVFTLPVSAAVVISKTTDNNVDNFEPVNVPQWFWERAYYSLDAKIEEWMTVRRNAALFGSGDNTDDKSKAKILADTDSNKSKKSKTSTTVKKDAENIKSAADGKPVIKSPSAKVGSSASANNETIDTNAEISGAENGDSLSKTEEILKKR